MHNLKGRLMYSENIVSYISWVVEIEGISSSLFMFTFMLWANICNSCFRKKPHIASLLLILKVNELHKGVNIYLFFLYHNPFIIEKIPMLEIQNYGNKTPTQRCTKMENHLRRNFIKLKYLLVTFLIERIDVRYLLTS